MHIQQFIKSFRISTRLERRGGILISPHTVNSVLNQNVIVVVYNTRSVKDDEWSVTLDRNISTDREYKIATTAGILRRSGWEPIYKILPGRPYLLIGCPTWYIGTVACRKCTR